MFETYSGKSVNLFEFDESMIDFDDIARGLANECRFSGQCDPHYSVGQHSILVMELCDGPHKMQGLMHDCEEGYFKDMPSPLKRHKLMTHYKSACERAREIILGHYGICPVITKEVHEADRFAYAVECANITKRKGFDTNIKLPVWYPELTYSMFRKAYITLKGGHKWHNVLIPASST